MKKLLFRMALVLIGVLVTVGFISTISFAASASTHGYISIAFDDGCQTQYDYAFPLLQARGMNATFYVITSSVGTSSYMTVAELQTLQNHGCEIGSHSNTHPVFTSLADSQIMQECQISKQKLQSWGLTANNFAYPYGGRNSHTDSIVAEYYQSARSAYAGPYIMQFPISQFVLPGFAGETGDSTALSKLESMVDQVYSTNGWAIFFFHNVMPNPNGNPDAISTTDFASFLNYIVSKGVATLTVNQALNLGAPLIMPPSITITPTSVNMYLGQTQTFNSTVTGGRPPYAYQWYLNNTPVSSTNGISWTFTPTQTGFYKVYLNVTDNLNNLGQSNIANSIQVYNQYPLTMSTNYGTVSPSSGWVNEGSIVSISATAPIAATGERYVWLGWTGSGAGSYTGINNPASITMNGAITETAQWEHDYYLTVSSAYSSVNGGGWYDSGTFAYATVTPLTVAGPTGTQCVFTGWSGDASGTTSPSNSITMNGPKTATANWKTQYLVTFSQSGVSTDFSGTVMTINGTGYDRAGFAAWSNAGDVYTFSYASPMVVTANGKLYLLTGVSGNSTASSLTVSEATTVTGAYKIQYDLTVSSAYDSPSPLSGWFDSGSSITGSVVSPVSDGTGTQYVCTGWSGTGSVPASGNASAVTFTINAPSAITWNWKTQYLVSFAVSPSVAGTTSPSGTNLWEDPGTISIAATPYYDYKFISWSTDTGNITFGFPTLSSTTATINGPGTITANLATAPTPTPTHTPTPSASPSTSPSPTLPPSQSPTTSPSSSPSQSPSAVYNIGTYCGYSVVVALIIGGVLTAFMAIHKRNKTFLLN